VVVRSNNITQTSKSIQPSLFWNGPRQISGLKVKFGVSRYAGQHIRKFTHTDYITRNDLNPKRSFK